VSGSNTKPEARAASANPTEDHPQSPAAIGAILNDLHGFIAYGELILRGLASNPNYPAPTPGIIKLEDWLFYLTSHVFPDLGPFPSSGGTIALRPPEFDHGPRLSVILRYLDCQAVREALQRLQSHLIELNKLDPIRPAPPPPRLNRRRLFFDEDESWKIQTPSDDEWARKREALGWDIVTEFGTFLGWFRSLRGRLADRLHEGEESHGNISWRATVGVGGAADQRETERSPTTAPSSPLPAQMMGKEPPRQDLPEWDKENLRLRWKDEVVRTIRCDADDVILILDSFHEQGWPQRILNPLPGPPENREEKLNSAISSLNHKLKMLRFHTARNCKEIWWEPI
jgi:hypothetical protein